MSNSELKEPIQKRAIEKKDRILKYGFELMCEKGYHNVDCIEIAKASDVSTGTVYRYFNDKREIFLEGLKNTYKEKLFPIFEFKEKPIKMDNLHEIINNFIDISVKKHNMTQVAHEEIMAMKHSDPEVNKIFQEFEIGATDILVQILKDNNFEVENIHEKAHLIIYWIDDLCHEVIYHKHKDFNYDKMKEIVIDSIIHLLK